MDVNKMIQAESTLPYKYFDKNKQKLLAGGLVPDVRTLVKQLVVAALLGDQKAVQQIEQIRQMAELGDQRAAQLYLIVDEVTKELQEQLQALVAYAKKGARINKVRSIKGMCPQGEEKVYLKNGGCMCQKKAESTPKIQNGGTKEYFPKEKCGSKIKKNADGDAIEPAQERYRNGTYQRDVKKEYFKGDKSREEWISAPGGAVIAREVSYTSPTDSVVTYYEKAPSEATYVRGTNYIPEDYNPGFLRKIFNIFDRNPLHYERAATRWKDASSLYK